MIALEIFESWILADLISGGVHWFMDRHLEKTGMLSGIVRDNELHHARPAAMLELTPSENVNTSLPALGAALVLAFFGAYFMALTFFFLFFGNLVHRWAHAPRSEVPTIARALQRVGIFQSPEHHARHHRAGGHLLEPQEAFRSYCVMSNFVNPVVDAVFAPRA